jgi:hypothetical protein
MHRSVTSHLNFAFFHLAHVLVASLTQFDRIDHHHHNANPAQNVQQRAQQLQ